MDARRSLFALVASLVGMALLVPTPAFAYLDPGSGSFFLQSMIAVALAALFTLRTFWSRLRKRIKDWLAKKPNDE